MKNKGKPAFSPAEIFGWKRHLFVDFANDSEPFLTHHETNTLNMTNELQRMGKSMAITGESGAGDSTLLRETGQSLDSAFDDFGQLWVADFLHGPTLRFGKEKCKVYLHAILDNATRYIVSADFFLSEGVEPMMSELKNAIRRYGLPLFYYSDNGSAYKSHCLKQVGARLKIETSHSSLYKPQGRAKIERFFGTVRQQFLGVPEFQTFEEIRSAFQIWLARYHQRNHEGIGCSPLQKRMQVKSVCRPLPELAIIDPLFQ